MNNKPIIVVGRPYSGTTMTMQILEKLGVNIGTKEHYLTPTIPRAWTLGERAWNVRELPTVRFIMHKDNLKKKDRDKYLDDVFTGSELWAFKYLFELKNLDSFLKDYDEAKLIFVNRESESRTWPDREGKWKEKQKDYSKDLDKFLDKHANVKKLIFDYDRAVNEPEIKVSTIAEFIGTDYTQELRIWTKDFIKKEGVRVYG